ncbi:hypothetical protein PsYK624_026370 [Phanerochaete sordida]|uniref:Fungal-type protein kinase domain-containing protein n=1 Tax=Phanerochaete sordida TaxID=48140 RepID=A0A9P3G085_9APHY|nr:hypothetical protein PsYK624_026370 [Phanerochaete sordida]
MDTHYALISMKQFRQRFAPGPCLSPDQRKAVVSIEPLRDVIPAALSKKRPTEGEEIPASTSHATGGPANDSTTSRPDYDPSALEGLAAVSGTSTSTGVTSSLGINAQPSRNTTDVPLGDFSASADGTGLGASSSPAGIPKRKPAAKSEDPMYPPIQATFNSIMSKTRSSARFYITAHHPETGQSDSKPDLTLYPGKDEVKDAEKAYTLDEKHLKKHPGAARCAWGYAIAPLEVKLDDEGAGFLFSPPVQLRETKRQKKGDEEPSAPRDVGAGDDPEVEMADVPPADASEEQLDPKGKGKGKGRATRSTTGRGQKAKVVAGVRKPAKHRAKAGAGKKSKGKLTSKEKPMDVDRAPPAEPPVAGSSNPPEEAEQAAKPAPPVQEKIIPRSAEETLHKSDRGNKSRAQHAKYAAQIMLRQHRLHVISFYISGAYIRAFRWDQAGCIMTDAVNLLDNPDDFYDLLYCLGNLGDKWWGFDDTAVRASEAEKKLIEAYQTTNEHLDRARKDIWDNKLQYPIYKITCPSVSIPNRFSAQGSADEEYDATRDEEEDPEAKPPDEREFLVGKLTAGHGAPIGRCTRGFIAFDLWTKDWCFMKDQWRSSVRRSELDVYTRLHERGVRFIATPIAGGEVRGMLRSPQHTTSQRYLADGPKQAALMRIHMRIVLKEVGMPLAAYFDSVELLQTCTYAVLAHKEAWEKAGVLHRDISEQNIMIDVRSKNGFLNDWDLSKFKDDFGKRAREANGISGTWPFLSSLALQYPTKPPEVADDLESFIHVVLLMAYRFHNHRRSTILPEGTQPSVATITVANNSNKVLAEDINNYFYEQHPATNGRYVGGYNKHTAIKIGQPPIYLWDQSSLLAQFLQRAFALLRQHYEKVDFEALRPYSVPHKTQIRAGRAFAARQITPTIPENAAVAGPSSAKGDGVAKAARSTAAEQGKVRPLDTHTAILRLFDSAVPESIMGDDDYLFDQFLGLPDLVARKPLPTGMQKSGTSGMKRSMPDP